MSYHFSKIFLCVFWQNCEILPNIAIVFPDFFHICVSLLKGNMRELNLSWLWPEIRQMLLRLKHQQSHASGNNLTIFSSSLRIENWQKVTISWNFCKLILSHEDVTKITIQRLLYIKKGVSITMFNVLLSEKFCIPL